MRTPGTLTSSSEREGKEDPHISVLSWGLFKCHFFSLFPLVVCACPLPAWRAGSSFCVLEPLLLHYCKMPLRSQDLLALCFSGCLSNFSCTENLLHKQTIRPFSISHHLPCLFWVYHLINSHFQNIISFFLLRQGHENTHSHTYINRPWQGCVSRWQRWRGHGHRAVWGAALHEVNHPDTWRRTGTVRAPPGWCGLVTTGQRTRECEMWSKQIHEIVMETFFFFVHHIVTESFYLQNILTGAPISLC